MQQPPPVSAAFVRRFKSSDVAEHLDMAVIGDICVGVSLTGLRQLLAGFLRDQSGHTAALLAELDAGRTGALREKAHALKGTAASLGLRAVVATGRRIESAGPGFDAAECEAAAHELRERLGTVQALLQRMGFLEPG